jgi:nucleoside 2-deoxyribosyltransferase
MSLIYLASPYSHPDPAEKEKRYREACRVAGNLMRRGKCVFSPIAHSHPIEQNFEQGGAEGHAFWLKQDFAVLRHCTEMLVLMLDGWESSSGVAAEVEFCKTLQIPVSYIEP